MAVAFYSAPTILVLFLILANFSYIGVDRNRSNNFYYGTDIQFAPKFPCMTVFEAPKLLCFESGLTAILGPLQTKHEMSTSRRYRRFSKSRVQYYSNSTATFAFNLILLAGDIGVNPGMPVNANGARKPQNNIEIAHLNARSIKNRDHYILTKNLVAENDFDIFTVSETWLDNSVTDLEVEIPGYDVYRAVVFVHMLENLTRLNIYTTCLLFHPRAFTSCGSKYSLVTASRLLFAQYIDRLTLI